MKCTTINGLIAGLCTGLLAACGSNSDSSANNSKMLATTAACYAAWNSTTAYNGGASVSYNSVNYTAAYWTQGQNPSTNNGPSGSGQPWISNGGCGGTPTPTPTPAPTPTPTPAPTPTPTGSCAQYVSGHTYAAGDKVTNVGGYYQCTVGGWCSMGGAYEPGVGWAWANAWSQITASQCGSSSPTPTPAPTPTPTPAPTPTPTGGFVVTEAQFNQMFPSRNSFYTYQGLVNAAGAIAGFATTGTDTVKKQEAAAFLANVNHETGGLVYIEEIDKSGNYCDMSQSYGCPAGANQYYGRGPIQLSWNFNYKAAGDWMGVNLLNTPSLVATDATISWKSAIWYWMTQNGPGPMTAHNAMINSSGFGYTIRAINGSLECDGRNPAQVQSRVNAYNNFVQILGVPAGSLAGC